MAKPRRSLYLPEGAPERARALVAPLQSSIGDVATVTESDVYRMALAEGLRVLEARFSTAGQQGADMGQEPLTTTAPCPPAWDARPVFTTAAGWPEARVPVNDPAEAFELCRAIESVAGARYIYPPVDGCIPVWAADPSIVTAAVEAAEMARGAHRAGGEG